MAPPWPSRPLAMAPALFPNRRCNSTLAAPSPPCEPSPRGPLNLPCPSLVPRHASARTSKSPRPHPSASRTRRAFCVVPCLPSAGAALTLALDRNVQIVRDLRPLSFCRDGARRVGSTTSCAHAEAKVQESPARRSVISLVSYFSFRLAVHQPRGPFPLHAPLHHTTILVFFQPPVLRLPECGVIQPGFQCFLVTRLQGAEEKEGQWRLWLSHPKGALATRL